MPHGRWAAPRRSRRPCRYREPAGRGRCHPALVRQARMNIPFAQIDAFASAPFTGNPAAVMPLHAWLDDTTLQAIAAENNLSETAFLVPSGDDDADFEDRKSTRLNSSH